MGLDITLVRFENFEETLQKENEHRQYADKLWDEVDYDSLTDDQKNEIYNKTKKFATDLGLDEWGSDKTNKITIEETHPNYSGHYFKIGYFRSSYNESGINNILRNLGIPDLYYIFNRNKDDDNYFQPNWEDSLSRCIEVIDLFVKTKPYRVHHFSENIFSPSTITNEKEALDVFLGEEQKNERSNYGNINGDFFFEEPLKVLGIIPGLKELIGKRPCVYVITESDNTWYLYALQIVKDTIQFVIDKEDTEKYYLSWCG